MPAAFTLYGNLNSTASNRVRLMLADANFTNYDFVMLNFQKSEQKSPAHLSRNPYGRIPVLTMPDGFTLYESRAISKFLAAQFGLPYVPSPSDLKARALFDQAEGAEASHFSPSADTISYEKFAKQLRGLETDEKRVGEARERLEGHFDVLEGILGEQAFMAGKEFSLVDICYVVMVDRLRNCGEGELVSGRKNLSAWWARCLERPAVKKFMRELLTLEDIKKRIAAAKG